MAFAGVERQRGAGRGHRLRRTVRRHGGRRARSRQASKYDLLDIGNKSDNLIIRL
jgi:hypothetical protein